MTTLAEAQQRYPGAVPFRFGDNRSLNAEILALIRAGRKTVTCAALAAFDASGEPMPEPGRIDLALTRDGAPALAIRTVSVEIIRFGEVAEAHIPLQGEFESLAQWRLGYEAYLRRSGFFDWEAPMILETFEMIEDFRVSA
ncbi:MAG: ASCH domain-containing protein [Roseobacter sp.]